MATLLLGAAGAAAGGALLGPVGAIAGRALGAVAGSVVDAGLTGGGRGTTRQGARLTDLDVMTSSEGAAVPRLYGRARLSGQVIWGTRLEEVVSTQKGTSGGKGGSAARAASTTITYSYYASFAVALCEGPVTRIGRIWADGKPLDTTGLVIRTYTGGEGQLPDPWIEAKQGAGNAPAYRGLAYVVFERLPLARFGNRVPQIAAEVERAVGRLEREARAVALIPGATEFGYAPGQLLQVLGPGAYRPENRHVFHGASDFEASLDQLMALCPHLERVSLVVSWFGDDLRAGACVIKPKVEIATKQTLPVSWQVGSLTRALADVVSTHDGAPAYGGTPADSAVIVAIQALRARGLQVTLNPFVMMDIPPGNARPDPWTGAGSQPAYPWRGHLTCDPAPGRPGSPDGTAGAAGQIGQLFGGASPGHFANWFGTLLYFGPDEWSLRRMVLHYAHLAQMAGGVEAFLIGSEFAALTRVRGADGASPAAAALAALAADVKAVVGAGTQVSYGADWTEFGAQVHADGDVRFPLDVLWGSPAVDFVGIDYYPPIADWRDGTAHLDAAVSPSIHDRAYLKGRLRAGEAYDWYYPDEAARDAQARSPITDGAYDEPWIFRQKDLWSWWANAHHERGAGVRAALSTAWVPGSKPIRLTEAGCPAVDKGANRPSVFPDPKSSDGGLPPYSDGGRDDFAQRRTLEAMLATFGDGAGADDNPVAPAYGGRMVEPGCVFLWCWDARPYPQFPLAAGVWADSANWHTGHWLTGRLGTAPLEDLLLALCADYGITEVAADGVAGVIDGYVVDSLMSARDAIEPLARAFAFSAREQDGAILFAGRGTGPVTDIAEADLVSADGAPPLKLVRGQESEVPAEVSLTFLEGGGDFRAASVASRRLAGGSRHKLAASLPVIAHRGLMERAADLWLQDLWAQRETATFALPPSRLSVTPGDLLRVSADGRSHLFEVTRIEDAEARGVTARTIVPELFAAPAAPPQSRSLPLPAASGPPEVVLLDLPLVKAAEPVPLQHLAVFADPWPGTCAVWRSLDGASFEAVALAAAPATMGLLAEDLAPGPLWRFDRSTRCPVDLFGGALSAASALEVLDGANALALFAEGRGVEVLQFSEAELVGGRRYALSGLLRGQMGTEADAALPWPAGTRWVLLDATLIEAASGLSVLGRRFVYRVGRADRDHGDEMVREVAGTVGGAALRPLSPVHLSARRDAAGIALGWIRRSRIDADFDAAEVPLGEEAERYRLDIVSGGDVVRSVETATPAFLYTPSLELADFGAPLSTITFRVAQLSATVGAGAAATAVRDL